MCEKCVQYDDKIARYGRLSLEINDRQTLDGIAVLIAQATDAKAVIHRLHRTGSQQHGFTFGAGFLAGLLMFDFDLFSKREWATMIVAFVAVTALALYCFFKFLSLSYMDACKAPRFPAHKPLFHPLFNGTIGRTQASPGAAGSTHVVGL